MGALGCKRERERREDKVGYYWLCMPFDNMKCEDYSTVSTCHSMSAALTDFNVSSGLGSGPALDTVCGWGWGRQTVSWVWRPLAACPLRSGGVEDGGLEAQRMGESGSEACTQSSDMVSCVCFLCVLMCVSRPRICFLCVMGARPRGHTVTHQHSGPPLSQSDTGPHVTACTHKHTDT